MVNLSRLLNHSLLEEMSDPSRLQTKVYLNSMWDHVKAGIAEARGLTPEKVSALADEMPMFRSDDMLMASGLIDGLKYKGRIN